MEDMLKERIKPRLEQMVGECRNLISNLEQNMTQNPTAIERVYQDSTKSFISNHMDKMISLVEAVDGVLKIYENEREDLSIEEWGKCFVEVFGDNGVVALAWFCAAHFRDIILDVFTYFPHLFLFGPPHTGKSLTARTLQKVLPEVILMTDVDYHYRAGEPICVTSQKMWAELTDDCIFLNYTIHEYSDQEAEKAKTLHNFSLDTKRRFSRYWDVVEEKIEEYTERLHDHIVECLEKEGITPDYTTLLNYSIILSVVEIITTGTPIRLGVNKNKFFDACFENLKRYIKQNQ